MVLARPSLSHPCDPNPIYLRASDYRVYEKLKHWPYTMESDMKDGKYIWRGRMKNKQWYCLDEKFDLHINFHLINEIYTSNILGPN